MATQTVPKQGRRFGDRDRVDGRGASRHPLWRYGGYVLFIAVWQVLATYVFEPFKLPGPYVILQEMWDILGRGDFWENFYATLEHLLIGFVLALLIGATIGIAIGRSVYWEGFFSDYVMLTLTTPGLVFALIAVMIFGLSEVGPIVAIVLTSFPHVSVNVVEGVRAIPAELNDMATAYGVDRRTRLRNVLIPAVAPFLFTAVRYGFAIAWKITALTELFGGSAGIGRQMRVEFQLFSVLGGRAWAFFLIGFALIMERLVLQRLERRFFRWRQAAFA